MALVIWIRNQWDRVLAWTLVAIGGLMLVLGWVGVTSTPYSFEQIPYVVSGGLGGIFVLGVAAMLWISADLRDEWRKLDELLQLERGHNLEVSSPTSAAPGGEIAGIQALVAEASSRTRSVSENGRSTRRSQPKATEGR